MINNSYLVKDKESGAVWLFSMGYKYAIANTQTAAKFGFDLHKVEIKTPEEIYHVKEGAAIHAKGTAKYN